MKEYKSYVPVLILFFGISYYYFKIFFILLFLERKGRCNYWAGEEQGRA